LLNRLSKLADFAIQFAAKELLTHHTRSEMRRKEKQRHCRRWRRIILFRAPRPAGRGRKSAL